MSHLSIMVLYEVGNNISARQNVTPARNKCQRELSRAWAGDPTVQPVYLTIGPENPNGAAFRLFIEAEMAPALAGDGAAYSRAVALFDGNNADELAAARAQWKELKDLGFALTYWQQNANGHWELKS